MHSTCTQHASQWTIQGTNISSSTIILTLEAQCINYCTAVDFQEVQKFQKYPTYKFEDQSIGAHISLG